VEGMEAAEAEVPAAERRAALSRARRHWALALRELGPAGRRRGCAKRFWHWSSGGIG
jgi:hypothetical protein